MKLTRANKLIIYANEHYYIDNNCNVYHTETNRKRKLILRSKNKKYYVFGIRYNKKVFKIDVHRLQAYQLYGDRIFEKGIQVRHLDGNSLNNNINNIAIGTQSDNRMDIPAGKRMQISKNASQYVKRFTNEIVLSMRKDRKNGMKYEDLILKYNVKKSTLSYIINKKTYADVI
jgi:hypothetical protein